MINYHRTDSLYFGKGRPMVIDYSPSDRVIRAGLFICSPVELTIPLSGFEDFFKTSTMLFSRKSRPMVIDHFLFVCSPVVLASPKLPTKPELELMRR